MELSHTFSISFTMYNRKYLRNGIDSKTVDIRLKSVVNSNETFDLRTLIEVADNLKRDISKGAIIQYDDPYLIHLLEPKSGATVHNLLNEIRTKIPAKGHRVFGKSVPPETLNGFSVLVLGNGLSATLEGVAEWILRNSRKEVTEVTIYDGELSVKVSSDDIENLLL